MSTKCMFIDDWNCPVTYDEFPLEVCKICIKARAIHSDTTMIKVPENGGDTREPEDISKMIQEVRSGGKDRKPEKRESREEKYTHEELNKKFHEGKLSVDEYIKKRKKLPTISKTEQG